jgi:hypothetical protein
VPRSLLGLEVVARGEACEAGDEVRGDRADCVVVVEGGVVVDVAADGNLVLRPGELLLEVCKPLLGAQLGVRFGDGQEVPDSPRQGALGLALLLDSGRGAGAVAALTTAPRVSDSWVA